MFPPILLLKLSQSNFVITREKCWNVAKAFAAWKFFSNLDSNIKLRFGELFSFTNLQRSFLLQMPHPYSTAIIKVRLTPNVLYSTFCAVGIIPMCF